MEEINCSEPIPVENKFHSSYIFNLSDEQRASEKLRRTVVLTCIAFLILIASYYTVLMINYRKPGGGEALYSNGLVCVMENEKWGYVNEKGKLVIHSRSADLNLNALAEGIGVQPELLAVMQNPATGASENKTGPAVEGLLGVAAMISKKPVYLEL